VRVLHLIQATGDHAAAARCAFASLAACAARIAASPTDDHRVLLIGDTSAQNQPRLAGLRVDRMLHPPFGIAALAWSAIRSERAMQPEQVELWTPGLEAIARSALGPWPGAWPNAWRGRASERPRFVVPEPLDTITRVGTQPSVAAQGPGHGTPQPLRRDLRDTLGATDHDTVVALLADPPSDGDARHFAFVLGLVEVGVGPVVALMSAGSTQLLRGRRLHRLAVRRSALHVVAGSVLPHLDAADVAMLQGPRHPASIAAARQALARGIPIVGPTWLEAQFPESLDNRVFTTDGRMRSMLPAMLRAIRASSRPAPSAAPPTVPQPVPTGMALHA